MNLLEAMRLFVRVAELGSFAAAAGQLGAARSVVTRQIAALEAHLGIKLMIRSTRQLSLTSAGSAYLEKCRLILDLVQEAETEVMEERLTPSGQLRVSLPLSYGLRCLMPLLLEFSQTYPEISFVMDFSDRQLHLIEEGIDLSIRVTSQLASGEIVRRLGHSRLLTVAAPQYLAVHGRPLTPSDLSEHACLGYANEVKISPWTFEVAGNIESCYVPLRLQANNGDALAAAAVQGMGIARLPEFIVAELLAAQQLEVLLADYEAQPLGIYAVLPSNRYIPHRVRVLIDFLSDKLMDMKQ